MNQKETRWNDAKFGKMSNPDFWEKEGSHWREQQ